MTEPKIKMPKKSVVERRQQVLEVLIGLLNSEDGMRRVTTERLAAVGVSEGALYRYFSSKTKMFEALIERIEQTLTSYINASKRKENSTALAVKAILYTVIEFARKNPGVTRILTGHALMFEDDQLKVRVAKFFDGLEFQFANILQMSKLREGKSFEDERALAGYLVNFCEGQFLRLVRSNFSYNQHQHFEKQWALIKPLFE
ncbi:nucleoid occlusion factor SlmA [Actinobacillus arthritidis]|uniref:nucleoid occlusion factor SlmA n=1 Tax=Actinobacillus arthritidis TaxID=157339 RepID=UPI0024436111|nr:nucleoid occlusion factor SlmA [Actinobacillus arthritidis]WGE88893.1 nucleoid occlusion factor SlmA [Actinobacillus arthritidis]